MTFDPAQSLSIIETALRSAIRIVLPDWQSKLDDEAIAKLKAKAAEELKRRDGAVPSTDLLDYTETYQLTDLVLKEWGNAPFKDVFDDKARTTSYFGLLADYRNTVAHGRELLDHERELLSGVAGQLRNQVGLYRSSSISQGRFYPLIESATDGFGRAGRTMVQYPDPAVRMDVGDEVRVTARAVQSARGFPLHWRLDVASHADVALGVVDIAHGVAEGEDVVVVHVLTAADIGEGRYLRLKLYSESKHHRRGDYDDAVGWRIDVSPPEDE